MVTPGDPEATAPLPWREDLQRRLRRLSVGMTSGLLFGLLIGGVGGRLAMLVLRLTSDASVRGIKSDDDFTIGRFSGESVFLLAFATLIGTLAGALYLVIRAWLPARRRPLWMGILAAVLAGSAIINPGGVDFTQLEPLWLAVLMFVLIPGLFGAAVSAFVERRLARAADAPGRSGRLAWLPALVVVPVLATGPLGLLITIGLVAGFVAQRQMPELEGATRKPIVMALGRSVLVAVGGLAGVALVRDVAEIL